MCENINQIEKYLLDQLEYIPGSYDPELEFKYYSQHVAHVRHECTNYDDLLFVLQDWEYENPEEVTSLEDAERLYYSLKYDANQLSHYIIREGGLDD
jgi:hypothetical protein